MVGPDSHYRLRATFHVTTNGELGFVRAKSNEVVPITSCDALAPELNDFLKQTRPAAGASEIHALSTRDIEVQGIKYRLHPEVFFQSNRFLLEPFVKEVVDQVGENPGNLLELYCGSGFFSLPLARRAKQLIGVEADSRAIRQARENAKLNGVWNTEFFEGQVDATLEGASIRPDGIILDPPRTGTGARNAARIAALKAPRIVYVSCNPSTFAREAAVFIAAGYRMDRLTMVDQFPNTYHIETVGMFSLGLHQSNR
jgi:23S rRNA (uracil1939-C5)-methyltransferase